jgi:predicted murein hydrolase (TIGR00659 family)
MWIILTLVVFYLARAFARKYPHPLNSAFLISMFIIIPTLLLLDIPYDTYFRDNYPIHYLLQPAVVALAYPLYEQLPAIRAHWKLILFTCTVGCFMSMLVSGVIAILLGAEMHLVAAILPKSVTTPISMAIAEQLGGEPAIASILVIIAGVTGSIFAYPIYKAININNSVAKGITMGCVSHGLGTAKSVEVHAKDGAFSSLAMVICGVITSLIAPMIFSLLALMNQYL